MTILDLKLSREAKQNWLLLFAVSAIIAVGITSFVAMMSAYRNLEQIKNHYYASCRLADFWIYLKKVPLQEISRLGKVSGVSEIRSRIQFPVLLDFPDSIKPIGSMLLTLPDSAAPVINNIIIREGTYFTPGRDNEVIVAEKFAKARKLRPGDSITAIMNNQQKELLIVATAISAEFVYMTSPGSMLDEAGTYGLMWIKRSFAEKSFGFENSANSIVGLFAKGKGMSERQLLDEMTEQLSDFGVFSAIPQKQQFSPLVLDGEMTQLRSMAISMPSFFLIVAALVLNIMMSRMAEQQRTAIGTLKALGYSNRQLTAHFLKYSIIPGLAGGIIGSVLGYMLAAIMTEMYLFYFSFPHLSNKFYPELISIGIGVSLLFAMLGTIKGIRKIINLEPAEAMRSAPPPQGGAVFLEKFTVFWESIQTQWQMILRNMLRNKARSAISIFATSIGSAIVLLTFGFVNSLDEMISSQFDKMLKSDYHLSFNEELSMDTIHLINRLPGVVGAEPTLHIPCNFENGNKKEKGSISGILPNSQLTALYDDENRELTLPGAGLLMSSRLMDKLGIESGDSLLVTPVKGDKKQVVMKVTEDLSSIIGMQVYGDINWLNEIFGQQQIMSEIRVKLTNDASLQRAFAEKIKAFPGIEGITDISSQKKVMVHQQDSLMGYAAGAMIGFAAVIFLGTILNTTLIAISERLRDIATFRTIGYTLGEVSTQFLKENMVINFFGSLIGIPMGYLMLISTMDSFATDAYTMPSALYPESILYTVILTICFVLIAQLIVVRKVKKLSWTEALSLKE